LRSRLPSQKFIEATFEAAGLEAVRHELVESELASTWWEDAQRIAGGGDSILAQLSRDDFASTRCMPTMKVSAWSNQLTISSTAETGLG
jgi:hypothetical protein